MANWVTQGVQLPSLNAAPSVGMVADAMTHLRASRAKATAESRTTVQGTFILLRALAMFRPVESGRPSVTTTLNCTPCTAESKKLV